VRAVEGFDDAEALVHAIEQGAVAIDEAPAAVGDQLPLMAWVSTWRRFQPFPGLARQNGHRLPKTTICSPFGEQNRT